MNKQSMDDPKVEAYLNKLNEHPEILELYLEYLNADEASDTKGAEKEDAGPKKSVDIVALAKEIEQRIEHTTPVEEKKS